MADIIDFLERKGADAGLRHTSLTDEEAALALASLDEGVRAALLARDKQLLQSLLGTSNVCCALMPPREPMQDEPGPDEEGEEFPPREEEPGLHRITRPVGAA